MTHLNIKERTMKIDKRVVWGVVGIVVLGLVALAAVNGPALWEMMLRMHGLR
jgi:hypothetical protein